ncbi:MAG: hypothetical protein HY717_10360 [Planctomycetes bacterium]|nr:hypothetical protein [Planctomycetota bacterium]
MRIENSAVAQQAAGLTVDTTRIDPAQGHAIGHSVGHTVRDAADRLEKTRRRKTEPISLRHADGEERAVRRSFLNAGQVRCLLESHGAKLAANCLSLTLNALDAHLIAGGPNKVARHDGRRYHHLDGVFRDHTLQLRYLKIVKDLCARSDGTVVVKPHGSRSDQFAQSASGAG